MEPTQLFKALSDVTRLRCLSLLIANNELCVCELTNALALPQPKVSHHLAALRKAELVVDRKDGLWIHYRINPDIPRWVLKVISALQDGTKGVEPFSRDMAALTEMPANPGEIYMPDSNQ